jgi:predicted ATPase
MAVEIIGRRKELLALEAFLTDVPAGGQALLLEGDAGIGKTALWQEGLRSARERDIKVLQARPSESEGRLAFAALGDLVAPALGPGLQQLVLPQRRALETALLLRESDGAPPEVRVLGLALLSIMRRLAQEHPVLVAIDDVQWLDEASADAVTFAARRLDGEPVRFLLTRRPRAPAQLERALGPGLQRLSAARVAWRDRQGQAGVRAAPGAQRRAWRGRLLRLGPAAPV